MKVMMLNNLTINGLETSNKRNRYVQLYPRFNARLFRLFYSLKNFLLLTCMVHTGHYIYLSIIESKHRFNTKTEFLLY